jgi:hypothetical protein
MRLQAVAWAPALSFAAVVVHAQAGPAPACTGKETAPPAFSGWSARSPMVSAVGAPGLSKAALTIGKGVEGGLHPTREVGYVTQPEKPGGSVSHGGMFALDVDKAGTYRVALGAGAWIDMLKDGKALVSTGHGMGPPCSCVRKIVDFSLGPGRYVLQVSANAGETLPIMVMRRP